MAVQKFKMILAFVIIFTYAELANADTKVLRNISIPDEYSYREEIISLENDNDLVIKGLLIDVFALPNDPDHILKSTIDYVADKNGYRVKYRRVVEEFDLILRFTPSTLKSLTG